MTNIIYKIEDKMVWAQAEANGVYTGSPLDQSDGFIHLSAADQVRETAGKWFTSRAGLVLVSVDAQQLEHTLRWEASRGGALFPHIYGDLPMSCVREVVDMELDSEGKHIFGPAIP